MALPTPPARLDGAHSMNNNTSKLNSRIVFLAFIFLFPSDWRERSERSDSGRASWPSLRACHHWLTLCSGQECQPSSGPTVILTVIRREQSGLAIIISLLSLVWAAASCRPARWTLASVQTGSDQLDISHITPISLTSSHSESLSYKDYGKTNYGDRAFLNPWNWLIFKNECFLKIFLKWMFPKDFPKMNVS